MDDLISKKDLLLETGISYGQLYRWKRERLIPDSWFDKRALFTGQETYFPRTLILERVHFIMTHKDTHSLSELKNLLSPDAVSRSYDIGALAQLPNAKRSAHIYEAMFSTSTLNHGQALTVVICANYDSACSPNDETLIRFMAALDKWSNEKQLFSQTEGMLSVLRTDSGAIPAYITSNGEIAVEGAEIEYTISLNDISRKFTRMLNTIYEER